MPRPLAMAAIGISTGASIYAFWQTYAICTETAEMLADSSKRLKAMNETNKPIFSLPPNFHHDKELLQHEVDNLTETHHRCHFFKNYFSNKV